MPRAVVAHSGNAKPDLDMQYYEACRTGQLGEIKRHLAAGANLNMKHWGRDSALCSAIHMNRSEVVEYLVNQQGIAVNGRQFGGMTPLCCAIGYAASESVLLALLRHPKVQVNEACDPSVFILDLPNHGAMVMPAPLCLACYCVSPWRVRWLLRYPGISMNRSGWEVTGMMPMHAALISSNGINVVVVFLRHTTLKGLGLFCKERKSARMGVRRGWRRQRWPRRW